MEQAPVTTLPSVTELAAKQRQDSRKITVLAILIALLCGFAFIVFDLDSPILPTVLLIFIGIPVLIWYNTRIALYLLFAASCLFELYQTPYADALTDRVPFFWNINTIIQVYARVNFKAVPLNGAEVVIILAGITALVRGIVTNELSLDRGKFFVPIAVYIGFVTMGWVNGLLTGGDFKESLQEVRAQFYFMIAYLMAVNLVQERKHVRQFLWITAISIAFKGLLYTFRRYVTLAGMELPDQGVGSHEEAFLFDTFVMLLLTLQMCSVHPKLRTFMWIFLPLVITGNLATNRRAATAAMIVAVPILLLTAYRSLPHRRKFVSIVGISLMVGWSIYYPLFKNSDSMFAQPARAVKSQFEPNERDASSNLYRDAENANIMATVRLAPIQGYGYGKRMLHAVPIADISDSYEWWDLLPHNQVLWVWMRVGTFGFIAFWFMVSYILIGLALVVRSSESDNETKAVGIFAMITLSMLMIFGLLDLQMSSPRDMLFTGFWIGIAASLTRINSSEKNGSDELDATLGANGRRRLT
ncbi:MAG: O-antigen ligase family protein [Armatimonadaceae bacterium]